MQWKAPPLLRKWPDDGENANEAVMPDYSNLLPADEILDDSQDTDIEELNEGLDDVAASDNAGDADAEADEGEARSEGDDAPDDTGEGDEPARIGDGKTIPSELKELMAAHPDRAKLLKDLYFTNARYNKFGKVADLQKLQDTVAKFGSLEEAERVQARLEEIGDLDGLLEQHKSYEQLSQKLAAGDPSYVEAIAKSNPESFAKLAPSFLQRFGNDHPDQYNYLMSQVVMSTLINNGTLNGLSLLQQAAVTGNIEQVQQVVSQIMGNIGALQTLSQKAPAIPQTDPRKAELDRREQEFQQRQQETFVSDVKTQTSAWVSPEVGKVLFSYGKTVTGGLARRLDMAVKEEIGTMLAQNSTFQSKIKAAISRGDRDGALRTYRQYVAPLIGTATRKVAGEFGLKPPQKRQTSVSSSQASGRSQNATSNRSSSSDDGRYERVTNYPSPKDVNRDIPDYYDLAAKDMFVLKSGRRIKVIS